MEKLYSEVSESDKLMFAAAALSERQKNRLGNKVAALYQDVSDIALRAVAVLSALNSSDDLGVCTKLLDRCGKVNKKNLTSVKMLANRECCIANEYYSIGPFVKLLKSLKSAEVCLKLHCSGERSNDLLTGDDVTRVRVRWHDLTTDILKCIFELRAFGKQLQGEEDTDVNSSALKSSIETWLQQVRAGNSLFDNPDGPRLNLEIAPATQKASNASI